jgi:aminoglycoside phosphotransferase (APT) family kinase protein
MENIIEKLNEIFPDGQWVLHKTAHGESNQTFIGNNGRRKVFVKCDVTIPAAERLGELGVAPRLLHNGMTETRPYIIQEYAEGTYPDRPWFADNLHQLANFIKTYQQDQKLNTIPSKGLTSSYSEHLEKELFLLEKSVNDVSSVIFHTDEVRSGINALKQKSRSLRPVQLVPTHGDPNSKNFLITNNGLIMVDWDSIFISDPIKDAGLMLWWYVPKSKWKIFFEFYGQTLDEKKVFWWTAKASLQIAAWFGKQGDDENAAFFIRDFLDALEEKDNSQMYINNPNS